MDLSPFATTPAVRKDGWSPALKLRFLDHLAARGSVRGACAAAGMSHEAAYRLRRRDTLFARGWAAALCLARENGTDVLTCRAIDGVEEDIWYRGELVGTRRRYDSRLLLAHLARLDKLVDETPAGDEARRFDELLALIAGEEAPDELVTIDEPLPLDRAVAADIAAEAAEDERRDAEPDKLDGESRDEHDERIGGLQAQCRAEGERARAEALMQWDAWFQRACAKVDATLPEICSRTVSTESTSAVAEGSSAGPGRHT
jgi:hypothetical protein